MHSKKEEPDCLNGKCKFKWDAIVITCQKENVLTLNEEVNFLISKRFLRKNSVIVIEDSHTNLGSGGATINAILTVAEHLTALQNYTVVTQDIFINKCIIVFHYARNFLYDPLGRGMFCLPFETISFEYDHLVSNLLHLYLEITKLAEQNNFAAGIWVCSTDMHLNDIEIGFKCTTKDITVFSAYTEIDKVFEHGIYKIVNDEVVDLKYCPNMEELQECSNLDGYVPVVLGLVFFSTCAVNRLLSALMVSPLNGCTYIGLDNGAPALRLSLFFDVIAAALVDFRNLTEIQAKTRSHECHQCQTSFYDIDLKDILPKDELVVRCLRETFDGLNVGVIMLNGCVIPILPSSGVQLHAILLDSIKKINGCTSAYSFLPQVEVQNTSLFVNSIVHADAKFDGHSLVMHCEIPSSFSKTLYFCDVTLINLDKKLAEAVFSDNLPPPNVQVIAYTVALELPDSTTSKLSLKLLTSWGRNDNPMQFDGTVFNQAWSVFLVRTGIVDEDLWNVSIAKENRNLFNARLFPILGVAHDPQNIGQLFHWLWGVSGVSNKLDMWRNSWRCSLKDILCRADFSAELKWRSSLRQLFACLRLRYILSNGYTEGLIRLLRTAVAENASINLFNELDSLLELVVDTGQQARVFAVIADLLSLMAMGHGGLRNGPASNQSWLSAYKLLDRGEIKQSALLMRQLREEWMLKPDNLMRASRHYERAVHTLIKRSVLTCDPRPSLPLIECKTLLPHSVTAVAPARLDFAGGWTDTPPIFYEEGGVVVNVSVLVAGRKPIGATCTRRNDIEGLLLIVDDVCQLSINQLCALEDYGSPQAPAALLKASLVFCNIVQLKQKETLEEQLVSRFGTNGLELRTWSVLPHGSGLGTSSILAACLLAVLWRFQGILNVSHEAIIQGVLIVEQMLSTGGGWQDQLGGIVPGGFKLGTSSRGFPLCIKIDRIQVDNTFFELLQSRLVLIYTGQTRLARDLLQVVIRQWYGRDSLFVNTVHQLAVNATRCAAALKAGNLNELSLCIMHYWSQKRVMATGAEPSKVTKLMSKLTSLLSCSALAGAGGGGFLYGLLRDGVSQEKLFNTVKQHNDDTGSNAEIYAVKIDTEGMVLYWT